MQISRFSYALPIAILVSLLASLPVRANIDLFAGQFFTPLESARTGFVATGAAVGTATGTAAGVANKMVQAAASWPISNEHDSVRASSKVVRSVSVSRQ